MLVSIVIPVFNRAHIIGDSIENLRLQTYRDYEIIVVDDGSTDNTWSVIQALAEKNKRIRGFRQERNTGAQAARNKGIKEARGEWIAFQDSDDLWVPEKLEKQMHEVAAGGYNPLTVVHADYFLHNLNKKKRTTIRLPLTHGDDALRVLLHQSTVVFPAILTSARALEQIGYLDEQAPSFHEWDTAIRLARICRFVHLKEPLFIYNILPDDAISKNTTKTIDGYQYIINKFEKEILQHGGEESYRNHIGALVEYALNVGLWGTAQEYLDKFSPSRDEGFRIYSNSVCHHLFHRKWPQAEFLFSCLDKVKRSKKDRLVLAILKTFYFFRINPSLLFKVYRGVKRKFGGDP